MSIGKIGRPVKLVSLSFNNKSTEEVVKVVNEEGLGKPDMIILPEVWRGGESEPETLEGVTVSIMAELAQRHSTYIVCPIYRKDETRRRVNTSVLIDRQGKVVYTYDKVFPYWSEFDLNPPCEVGLEAPVYDTDFGCIGMAICFDANFPEVWKRLADQGAELVIWSSAYSAGTTLQAHALNNNFYIITSTLVNDCIIYDITGKEILYEKSEDLNISRIILDLDRSIFHENFNIEKRDRLLSEHAGTVEQELYMEREQWFVMKSVKAGASVRQLTKSYGMEELRAYKDRSRYEIDKMRGWKFSG